MISYPPPPSQPPAPPRLPRKARRAASRGKDEGAGQLVLPHDVGAQTPDNDGRGLSAPPHDLHRTVGVLHVDTTGALKWASPAALPMLGRSLRDLLGQELSSLFAEAGPALAGALERAPRGERSALHVPRGGDPLATTHLTFVPQLVEGEYAGCCVFLAAGQHAAVADAEELDELEAQLEAVGRTHAVIEFDLRGNVLKVNDNFTKVMGYEAAELVGKHHAVLVDPSYAASDEYRAFWDDLAKGTFKAARFKRVTKSGAEVWLEASYNPIFDADGKPVKVVKYATDITEAERRDADLRGQVDAISRTYAVIEFDLRGNVLKVNENFTKGMGYTAAELVGAHHSRFVAPSYAASPEYAAFWADLAAGKTKCARFKRVTKSGADVWLEASYNPIFDAEGKPVKVVKYATDITAAEQRDADLRGQVQAIGRTHAVVEFDMTGHVLRVNENFTKVMGYTAAELVGKHHALFVDRAYADSREYKAFWAELAKGQFKSARFKRFDKAGRAVWLEASYNPIFDADGKLVKVVKYATDITAAELRDADHRGQMAAMSRIQCVVEFDLRGHIIKANDNFLAAVGYRSEDVVGRHHSMFVPPQERNSEEYASLWRDLARGRPLAQRFMRIARDGHEIWIQGSYNPVLDGDGRVIKVVKFATDITAAVAAEAANLRYAAMAENASWGMMYADNDGVIRYLNPACERVLRQIERHLPQRVESTLGSRIDAIFRTSGRAGEPLHDSQAPQRTKAKYGADTLELEQSALFDERRKRIGTMLTVRVITQREAFRQSTSLNTEQVAKRSEDLAAVAREMSQNAEYTATQADLVGSASETVAAAVSSVAASAEQMSSTVREIAKSANEAARVAVTAVRAADQTNRTVAQLGDSSSEIGKVIKTITSIAQQTNLLALNATIEAARAGEAGKGFAVVANEVKELAKQTAGATEDISRKIEAIQSDTRGAVNAIKHIGEIIGQINDFQNTIASAVEQQAATTNEIARNAADAATSSAMINGNIGSVTSASRSASEAASGTLRSAEELSQVATALRTALDQLEREI